MDKSAEFTREMIRLLGEAEKRLDNLAEILECDLKDLEARALALMNQRFMREVKWE